MPDREPIEPGIYRLPDGAIEIELHDAGGRGRRVQLDDTTLDEARQIRAEILANADARPQADRPAAPHRDPIVTVAASELVPRRMPMLWQHRIPAGTLAVIAGYEGLGKSTLASHIAADLSRGGLVSLLSMLEDDPHHVIRPRLDVAGANLDHVHIIPSSNAPVLTRPDSVQELEDLIGTLNVSMLVLDPIAAHFRPENRLHDRTILYRLLALARRTRCTILGIHHLTKSTGSIGGPSGGLSGSSRATYLYGYDPEDEDRRALACEKINGIDRPPALLFEHETVEYQGPDGRILEAGLLRPAGQSNARGVARRGRRRQDRDDDCAEWISVFLAAGDGCQRQVSELRQAGHDAGYSWATLLRVHLTLDLQDVQIGTRADGFTLWRLPDEHPLRPENPTEHEEPA